MPKMIDLRDGMTELGEKISQIHDLQNEKRRIEENIKTTLVQKNWTHCLTINKSALYRQLRSE